MKRGQNWDKSKLQDYLLYDYWQPYNAWRVLSGLDYFAPTKTKENDRTLDLLMPLELDFDDYISEVDDMTTNVDRLRDFWNSSKLEDDKYPPAFFVEWALCKRFRPDWLNWAIERSLYTPKQETRETTQPETAPPYSTAWLTIQQAAIAQFFNPRRNPDAKRDEVVEWIKQQAETTGLPDSNNIATTIFTIIKPANHDPKKKRVEPLE